MPLYDTAAVSRETQRRVGQTPTGRPTTGDGGPDGLVEYDITGRLSSDLHIYDVWSPQFPTSDMVDFVADEVRDALGVAEARKWQPGHDARSLRDRESAERISWRVTMSPGAMRMSSKKVGNEIDYTPWRGDRRQMEIDVDEATGTEEMEVPEECRKEANKTAISEWSAASRRAMVYRLSTLDYSGLTSDETGTPGMITLTMPGEWEHLAPTGEAFKRIFFKWKKRWARKFGSALSCIWKLEFQRRGAPHLHLFTVIPNEPGFREWLSTSWTACVGATGENLDRHLKAGTGVDIREGMRMRDPRRLVVYFLKHSAPGGSADKEYQNRAPDLWRDAGSVGRFWGYTGDLKPCERTIDLEPEKYLLMRRIARGWSRANAVARTVTQREERVNMTTGEITEVRRKRRIRGYMGSRGGYLTLNSGPMFVSALTSAVIEATRLVDDPTAQRSRLDRRKTFPPMDSPALRPMREETGLPGFVPDTATRSHHLPSLR